MQTGPQVGVHDLTKLQQDATLRLSNDIEAVGQHHYDNGNQNTHNVLYLPLDQMVPNAGQPRTSAGRASVSERDMREITDQVTEQLRRDLDAAAARRGGR